MTQDPLAVLLAEALRNLVDYVELRDDSFTDDDDVGALEGVASVLHQVEPTDIDRLRALLGPKMSFEVGLSEN
jgi:hypothetical protein